MVTPRDFVLHNFALPLTRAIGSMKENGRDWRMSSTTMTTKAARTVKAGQYARKRFSNLHKVYLRNICVKWGSDW